MMTWGLVLVLPLTFPRPQIFLYSACYRILLTMAYRGLLARLGSTKKRGPQVLI
jgi:hypothetical protein